MHREISEHARLPEISMVHRHESQQVPAVSFILADWSCRESLHMLDYLREQTVPRASYELLWIEYYDRRLPELAARQARALEAGLHPDVDVHAVMNMPASVYYHKHLIYNVGLLLARGRIVCICDSDALARPGLVEAITSAFEQDPNIVLHLDEVRNHDRAFHPFNYPAFDEITGPGCTNWINGRPAGLWNTTDPLHVRNYGACFCALREDLLAIGGADMHIDYLGHICGPYEMTFRLVNKGKREVWHDAEWLYHVWHPGQAGDQNHAGPHDGKHVSSTALAARDSGRVEPLLPHPAIRAVAAGEKGAEEVLQTGWCVPDWLTEWSIERLEATARSYQLGSETIAMLERQQPSHAPTEPLPLFGHSLSRAARLWLGPLLLQQVWRHFWIRFCVPTVQVAAGSTSTERPGLFSRLQRKYRALRALLTRLWGYNRQMMRHCWVHLSYAVACGHQELVVYGDGEAARMATRLARYLPISIHAVCTSDPNDPLAPRRAGQLSSNVWTIEQLQTWDGPVFVASFANSARHVARLESLGISRARLIVLE